MSKPIVCKVCEKIFFTENLKKRYCSDECKRIARNEQRKKRYQRNINKKRKHSYEELNTPVRCENPECGKMFIRKTGNQLYCCNACRNAVTHRSYQSYKNSNTAKTKPKYSANDIALIEKYYRVVCKVVKHYGIISYEVDNGKEYDLDAIRAAIRAQETQG
mgnify:CR=1 FL=1